MTAPNTVVLEDTLQDHGARCTFVTSHPGAAVDLLEFKVSPGVKLAKIQALAPDLALAVGVESVRILAPIPGTTNIGIEVPAAERTTVAYEEVALTERAIPRLTADLALPFPVGQQVGNGVIWADLAEAPHLLIAGATGSGKSVALNTILTSLIDHVDATSLRIHLVDPKRVELGQFKTAPQVENFVTDVDDAVDLLEDLVDEMERRYNLFESCGVRNLVEYHDRGVPLGYDEPTDKLPYHVLVIDEMADLMSQRKDDVELAVQRLTQLARAAGIHLIIATQRPSVNVITGVIKANIPTRWAFTVASQTDSRVILDANGAEALYGAGDSLWAPYGSLKAQRVQGVWTSDAEVERAVVQAAYRNIALDVPPTLNQSAAEEGDPLTPEDMGWVSEEQWAKCVVAPSDEIEENRRVSPTSREGQMRAIVRSEIAQPVIYPGVDLSKPIFAAPGINGGQWFNGPEQLDEAHGWQDVGYVVDEPVIRPEPRSFIEVVLEDRKNVADQHLAWARLATIWACVGAVVLTVLVAR